jgi:hypothetical protein
MSDLLALDSGSSFSMAAQARRAEARPGGRPNARADVDRIDLYDLPETDLSAYGGLLVPGSVDQEFMLTQRERIRAFLDRGRVLVFSGHLFRPWLPGAQPFVPAPIRSFRDYVVVPVTPHPIFEGVLPEDLTFRRGVAGFFARGSHPPPAGAEVLLALAGGQPIVYVDRVSTAGTILVHAGNDLLGYAGDDTTAGRVGPQLVAWIRQEYRALSARGARDAAGAAGAVEAVEAVDAGDAVDARERQRSA